MWPPAEAVQEQSQRRACCPRVRGSGDFQATLAHATTTHTPSNYMSGPAANASPMGSVPKADFQTMIQATEDFITFLDALKLDINSADRLHPLLSDVIQSANKATNNVDFEGRALIINWLIKLHNMRASEDVTEDEKRQLQFDIETAYGGFKAAMG
jgi:ESCRT-I complex subunit VPS28